MKERYTVTEPCDLLDFICKSLAGVPKSRIRIQLKRGEVRVNGVKTVTNINLNAGDGVEIFLPEKFAANKIEILYSDDNIIIADKPPFTESEYQLPELMRKQYSVDTYAVHRLDTNTTGVIILAKSQEVKQEFKRLFANGEIKKIYRAQVFGCPKQNEGRLTAYTVKNSQDAYCKVFNTPVEGSKEMITDYRVIRRGDVSVLELSPVTGRTHQLRAHLAHEGYPIVGDDKYGDEKLNRAVGAKIQKLRAISVTFLNEGGKLGYLYKKTVCAQVGQDYA